jgi:DNA-binding response OmpR family regulator
MARILTVDDSRSIRQIVQKQLATLGVEIEEAEDGQQGLAKLEELSVDLILLDVTMPVLDGVGMLEKLRASGNKTPVVMLTSESKRSIIATAMKLGIDDYILKPFKEQELRAKVTKSLRLANPDEAAAPASSAPAATPAPTPAASPRSIVDNAAKQFVDVLLVDDMESVAKKLRSLLPQHVSMNSTVSANEALSFARDRIYRTVLIDLVIPDVNSLTLMSQIRALQPHASFMALMLRTTSDPEEEVREQGFSGYLFKPFDPDLLDQFLTAHFDNQDLLQAENNVLRPAGFAGKEDRLDRYFNRLNELFKTALEKLAAACFDDAIVDLSAMPLKPDRTTRLLITVDQEAKKMGLSLRIVGTPEVSKLLGTFTDTAHIPFFGSVEQARGS